MVLPTGDRSQSVSCYEGRWGSQSETAGLRASLSVHREVVTRSRRACRETVMEVGPDASICASVAAARTAGN
jgi:hypothetical protein